MSEATPRSDNQLVTYLLVAIVVLLAIAVGIIIVQNNNANSVPDVSQLPGGGTQPTNPGMKSSTGSAFDPKTATKVPAGTKLDAYVKGYYQAILDKEWQTAFDMQPATSKSGVTVQDFQATQESYGMTSYKVSAVKTAGNEGTVDVEQDLGPNGKWGATWTFVKTDDGNWVVKSRAVAMK